MCVGSNETVASAVSRSTDQAHRIEPNRSNALSQFRTKGVCKYSGSAWARKVSRSHPHAHTTTTLFATGIDRDCHDDPNSPCLSRRSVAPQNPRKGRRIAQLKSQIQRDRRAKARPTRASQNNAGGPAAPATAARSLGCVSRPPPPSPCACPELVEGGYPPTAPSLNINRESQIHTPHTRTRQTNNAARPPGRGGGHGATTHASRSRSRSSRRRQGKMRAGSSGGRRGRGGGRAAHGAGGRGPADGHAAGGQRPRYVRWRAAGAAGWGCGARFY